MVGCIAAATAGATGKTIDEQARSALSSCKQPESPDLQPEGLFKGESCATVRATDVHYFLMLDGVRVLHWEGWHAWRCADDSTLEPTRAD